MRRNSLHTKKRRVRFAFFHEVSETMGSGSQSVARWTTSSITGELVRNADSQASAWNQKLCRSDPVI